MTSTARDKMERVYNCYLMALPGPGAGLSKRIPHHNAVVRKRVNVAVLAPPLLSQKGDFLGSGVPFFPLEAAYIAAVLRKEGHFVKVVDGFGESPRRRWEYKGKYCVQGLPPAEMIGRLPGKTELVVVSTGSSASANMTAPYSLSLELVKLAKSRLRATVVASGIIATNCYGAFLDAGADFVALGEPEETIARLARALGGGKPGLPKLDGVARKASRGAEVRPEMKLVEDLDSLPFPAFDLFPLKNYWGLGYAHGPVKGKYLPLLTSRGCTYGCAFCAVPKISQRKWRARSPKNVVDEMEFNIRNYGVSDFHLEDYNPTLDKERTVGICWEILRRKLRVTWKLAAGSKAERLDEDSLGWMAKAGCDYISISPESGSARVLKLMHKPVDHGHGLRMVRRMHQLGIKSQACFVLGFPGETNEDLALTKAYIGKLALAGLDEIALFIMTPLPGSEMMGAADWGYGDIEELTFSPKWRKGYARLARVRRDLYLYFIALKSARYPGKIARSAYNLLRRRYETKMEMAAYRVASEVRSGLRRGAPFLGAGGHRGN